MKVALVHDYIKEFGGAEKVLETLHEIFPKAPIYTTVYLPKYLGPHRERFEKYDIRTSFLQHIPFTGKFISMYRFFASEIFKAMDLSKYDLVITSAAGTYSSPNSVTIGKNTKLLCYCHTPPRYLYGYLTPNDWNKNIFRKILLTLGKIPMHFIRIVDFYAAQKVDLFIANSQEVKRRIEKFYRKNAIVINPPIETPTLKEKPISIKNRGYFIAGGRLARAKRVDLAVMVATKMGLPLKVFGREFARYGNELKQLAGPTVEFLGEIKDEEKEKLFSGARAYLSPSIDEDFGMLNVEMMAYGTPVIAHRSGGTLETIDEGKTGLLFDEATVKSLEQAIKKFEKMEFNPAVIISHAQKYSKERFIKEIKKVVERYAGTSRG
jgi:glycosyltransferase involved in cell wall biosynthesis